MHDASISRRRARREVVVEITELDIALGKRHNPEHCPLALAARRTFDVERATAGLAGVSILTRTGKYEWWATHEMAKEFVINFDRGKRTDPCLVRLSRGLGITSSSGRVR